MTFFLSQAAVPGTAVPSTQPDPDFTTFWWAGVTFVVSAAVAVALFWLYREAFDRWLTKGRVRRGIMTAMFVVVCPVVIAALVDVVDLSDAAAGRVDRWDPWLLSLAVTLFYATALSQVILWWHTDRWDDRLDAANDRVAIANDAKARAEDTLGFVLEVGNTVLSVVGKKADRVRTLLAKGAPKSSWILKCARRSILRCKSSRS